MREENETEKEALKKLDETGQAYRSEAKSYREIAKSGGPQAGLFEQKAKAADKRAAPVESSAREIRKMISNVGEGEADPPRLRILNGAFEFWNSPKAREAFMQKGDALWTDKTFIDQFKCNLFLHQVLRRSGYSMASLVEKTGLPVYAGKWNRPEFNPRGKFPIKGVMAADKMQGSWISDASSVIPQPGDIISYGPGNARQNRAHSAISLGYGIVINASDTSTFDSPNLHPSVPGQGVTIKEDSYFMNFYDRATIRSPLVP